MPKHTVQDFMTVGPVVIARGRTLSEAHRVMRERAIRHLPVVEAGTLVGLVSQRDLYLLETLQGVDPATETVEEAMTREIYSVPPDAPLHDVAAEMAERRIGSAVVVDRGSVIGLFTTTDALRALAAVQRGSRRAPAGSRSGRRPRSAS
ncbi:MAG TPA: CBS domain-containing protein [Anaeromyxobacteraceae bacterium]|nr:CBS domain-containing protein [Anaeromyxobacteraceae bacterium]